MSDWHPAETAPKDGRTILVIYQGWKTHIDDEPHRIVSIRWQEDGEFWELIEAVRHATSWSADPDFVLWQDAPTIPDLAIRDLTPRWLPPDPSEPEKHGEFVRMTREEYIREFGEDAASDLPPRS